MSLNPGIAEAQPDVDFFLRDGDRVMILGDSITEQMMYSSLIESYAVSRFPRWHISFRNTGWSGDHMSLRSRDGQENGFNRDLKPLMPTAVIIDFGMNDARGGDSGYGEYLRNARSMADRFASIGTRVAFVTPSPEERYEANQPAGSSYNGMLRKYSEGLKSVASEKNVPYIDQLNPMIATIEAGRTAGLLSKEQGGPRFIPDAVHPDWSGHLVMAAHILKGLKAPGLVSLVEIDARTKHVNASKATVTDLKAEEQISFTRLDESLPWPIPDNAALALKIPGFMPLDDLSRYILKITNAGAATYKLTIDDKDTGSYTREQLEAGVNLTTSGSPIKTQTDALLKAIREKNTIFSTRWRQVQISPVPFWIPKDVAENYRTAELNRLDAQIAAKELEIDNLRQPAAHKWVLSPVN